MRIAFQKSLYEKKNQPIVQICDSDVVIHAVMGPFLIWNFVRTRLITFFLWYENV